MSETKQRHRGITREQLVNDFAIRSFRDTGDEDYIAARMAYRAGLSYPSLWQSQQTIEKYLKCILLLHRIRAKKIYHSLTAALVKIDESPIKLDLKPSSLEFLRHIDEIGEYRYLEVSTVARGRDLVRLDRLVWELRRFCTLDPEPQQLNLQQGQIAPRYQLTGGLLEAIAASKANPAHEVLLWSNAFLGRRYRRKVTVPGWIHMRNAPLYMHPEILDHVLTYIFLPEHLVKAWRDHKAPSYEVPSTHP